MIYTARRDTTERLLVGRDEAARMLAVSAKTLDRLTRDGRLTAIRIGRSVRYSTAHLRQFADAAGQPAEVSR